MYQKGRLVTYRGLKSMYGIPYSRTHIARLVAAGRFPKPIKLGDGSRSFIGWWSSDLEEWLGSR